MNRPLIGAIFMSLLVVIYLAFALNYAWILVTDDSLLANAMGYALGLLPLLGAWVLVLELRFGRSSGVLASRLEAEGEMPTEFSRTPSGRADRPSAEALFPTFAKAVESQPERWQAWMRLGMAYDACGTGGAPGGLSAGPSAWQNLVLRLSPVAPQHPQR